MISEFKSASTPGSLALPDEPGSAGKSPQDASILLIGRDTTLLSYKAAVLATAKFRVHASSPAEAKPILENSANYDLVIFSHTLDGVEVAEMERTIHSSNPDTKLLLLLGPGSAPAPMGRFDATLYGLDGPTALIRTVQELTRRES